MQAKRTFLPEFDISRAQTKARPERWARNLAEAKPGGVFRYLCLELETPLQRL